MKPVCIGEYREAARRRLPRFLFEYIDGGSHNEQTLARNESDLAAILLRQRVLRDVSSVDLSVELLGETWRMPVALAPIGLAGANARRGEIQAARAAEAQQVPFCLSTVSVCAIDEVRASVVHPFWFQLYMIRDRGFMTELLSQASAAGCSTLVLTVDMPVPGTRYRDYRTGLTGASGWVGSVRRTFQALQRPRWAWDVGVHGRPHSLGNVAPVVGASGAPEDFFGWMRSNFDPRVTWADFDWVRARWSGRLVIKGILDRDDAHTAVNAGVDAIIVSNHGGRQLDGSLSTARALTLVADVIAGRLPVLADGGVRSGLDVIRLLALGANAVLIGRLWAYALGARGQEGVAHVLKLIESEMKVTLALAGINRIADINRSILAIAPTDEG